MFVYLSYENESNNWACLPEFKRRQVYFDDFKGTHIKSHIVQYNACLPKLRRQEYYPFGMQTTNSCLPTGALAKVGTREGATGNNFLGNGGTEFNATSNLYDLDYRNYDPVLGRMNGVDPMATKYASLTPYNYSFNDPVSFTDPNGADPSGYYSGAEPIFEEYTSWMYNPSYGWLQDDVIYQRLIGWKAPVARYVGRGLDWMFRGAGQGITGSGSWQASTFAGIAVPRGGRGMNITIDLNALPDGAHFFSFSNGNLTNYNFLSESTVLGLGSAYNLAFVGGTTGPIMSDYTGGPRLWGNTEATQFWYPGVETSNHTQRSTSRHPYDYGTSLSLSGNLTLGGGVSFELGFAWDNDGDYTWFFTLGPSIGFDASIGVLVKDYKAVNPRIGFDVTDIAGYGSAWNIAIGPYDGTYGGNLNATELNPFNFGFTYYEYGVGASFGSPFGLTFETTYTWIFGTKGNK